MWHWLGPCSDWPILRHLPLHNAPGITLEHTRLCPHRFNCGIRSWRQDFSERGCLSLCVFPALSCDASQVWAWESCNNGMTAAASWCILSTRHSLCRVTTSLKPWLMFRKCFGLYFCTFLGLCRKTLKSALFAGCFGSQLSATLKSGNRSSFVKFSCGHCKAQKLKVLETF